jgi:hypothetical protein
LHAAKVREHNQKVLDEKDRCEIIDFSLKPLKDLPSFEESMSKFLAHMQEEAEKRKLNEESRPVKLPPRERALFKQQVGPACAQGKRSECHG